MTTLFALIDYNNFYVSCERVLQQILSGKPVVVLSNNDGCVIARSEEAKALGIPMGLPAFQLADLLHGRCIEVYSSNYTLYGDMSARVMMTLAQWTPDVKVYSIDEAFLKLSALPPEALPVYGQTIRTTIQQWTSIPVSIGIGSTKTLAKRRIVWPNGLLTPTVWSRSPLLWTSKRSWHRPLSQTSGASAQDTQGA